ncbi:MAG: sugar phosphate isomerase/epimerase [Opitutaceae bacterium]|nr:sugar phosphate isomerase/epimerase [Opitutaceae bacterium]
MNRRRFLSRTLSAAAAAGATWFDVPRLLADMSPRPRKIYGDFPMGIQSYCFRAFGVEGALDRTRELGLGRIEFFRLHFPATRDAIKIQEMKDACARRGISISGHGVQAFSKDHAANDAFFKFVSAAKIPIITANPAPDAFESLNKLVAAYDLRIAIHNHGPGSQYSTIDDCLNAVKGSDPRIGFTADLGHFIRSDQDPVEAITRMAGRLYGVHLKDVAERKDKTTGVILGKGHLDVMGVFHALKKVRFPADGALSLEYEEHPDNPMAEIRECLAVAAEAASRVS